MCNDVFRSFEEEFKNFYTVDSANIYYKRFSRYLCKKVANFWNFSLSDAFILIWNWKLNHKNCRKILHLLIMQLIYKALHVFSVFFSFRDISDHVLAKSILLFNKRNDLGIIKPYSISFLEFRILLWLLSFWLLLDKQKKDQSNNVYKIVFLNKT